MKIINVAKDFTRFPSGRFRKNGATSGEAFREDYLEPPMRDGQMVIVELDGTIGYGSSFLEEAFGGLVRSLKWQSDDIKKKMQLTTDDSALLDEIWSYVKDAENQRSR